MNRQYDNTDILSCVYYNNFIKGESIEEDHSLYWVGTSCIDMLEGNNGENLSEIDSCRFLYIKNLLLKEPMQFLLSPNIGPYETFLMLCSFKYFDQAEDVLRSHLNVKASKVENEHFRLVGVKATSPSGANKSDIIVIDLIDDNTSPGGELIKYTDDDYSSVEFNTHKYSKNEMYWLYFYTQTILEEEENVVVKSGKIEAICKMAFFQNDPIFNLYFEYLYTTFFNKIHKLEDYLLDNEFSRHYFITQKVDNIRERFDIPIVPMFKIACAIGVAKKTLFYYDEAYEYFSRYNFMTDRIKCLKQMGKIELALADVDKAISGLERKTNNQLEYTEKIRLSNFYISKGNLLKDPTFYDTAFSIYNSKLALKAKCSHFYNKNEFKMAMECLTNSLSIYSNDLDFKYYLGCCYIQLERYGDSLKIFKMLSQSNPRNTNFAKNLSLCYYMLDDIHKTCDSLKLVALEDCYSMRMLLKLSIKNQMKEEIVWIIRHCRFSDIEMENFLKELKDKKVLEFLEIKKSLFKNTYVSKEKADNFLQNIFQ